MPLYQTSGFKKYLKQQDTAAIGKAYQTITSYFHDPAIQENNRQSKEEEFQGIFLTELFVKMLSYTIKPYLAVEGNKPEGIPAPRICLPRISDVFTNFKNSINAIKSKLNSLSR